MQALARLAFERPWTTLSVLLLVTGAAVLPLSRARIDNSLMSIVPKDDPDRLFLEEVFGDFGSDESVIIAISSPEGLTREAMGITAELAEELADLPGVSRVLTPFTGTLPTSEGDTLDLRSALEREETADREIAEILDDDPVLSGHLFRTAPDGRPTWAVLAELGGESITQEMRSGLVRGADRAAGSLPGDWEVHLTGVPYIKVRLTQYIQRNIMTYGAVVFLVLSSFLLIVLRTLRGVFLPLCTVAMAVLWTMGLLAATGNSINMYTSMIPSLLLFIGVTGSIHILSCYRQESEGGGDHREVVARMAGGMSTPCFMASLTTAAGFASLSVTDLPLIRSLGIFMAAGILFSLLISFSLIPAALSLLGPGPAGTGRFDLFARLPEALDSLVEAVRRHRTGIAVTAALLLVASVFGLPRLGVETHYLHYFREGDPVSEAVQFIEGRLTGTTVMDVILDTTSGTGLESPGLWNELREVEEILGRRPEVVRVLSARHALKGLHRALSGDPAAELPSDRRLLAQELLLLRSGSEADPLGGMFHEGSGRLRIRAYLRSISSKRLREIRGEIGGALRSRFDGRARITGTVPLLLNTMDRIVWGQVKSFGLIFIIVLLLMSVLMRSVKVGLVSMIPNVLPIFCAYAIMGFLAIPMNNPTVVNSCVGLGLAIDDTIHFLVRFRREFALERSYALAIRRTARTVGRAVVFTSLILAAGFTVFLFSDFRNISHFGSIAITITIAALIGDLVLLPLSLLILRPFGPGGAGRPAREVT